MTISRNSWMARWYGEWEARGGTRPPQMNLRHFVRVLVVWGPIRFIFMPKRAGWLLRCPPIFWALGATLGSFVFSYFLADTQELRAFLVATGIIASFVGAVLASLWIADKAQKPWDAAVETLQVYRNYRAARHNKICPLVKIGD